MFPGHESLASGLLFLRGLAHIGGFYSSFENSSTPADYLSAYSCTHHWKAKVYHHAIVMIQVGPSVEMRWLWAAKGNCSHRQEYCQDQSLSESKEEKAARSSVESDS